MIYTTLNAIRAHSPCKGGWEKLLEHLGKTKADDEPLSLLTIMESNGIEDALWCLRALDGMDGPIRELACNFAESALKYVPGGEDRPRQAIETARRYARGEVTEDELEAASSAAKDAAWAAARDAASFAAGAAAGAASWAAARDAAGAAAWAAAGAVARDAAGASAGDAAWAAAKDVQKELFTVWCNKWSTE